MEDPQTQPHTLPPQTMVYVKRSGSEASKGSNSQRTIATTSQSHIDTPSDASFAPDVEAESNSGSLSQSQSLGKDVGEPPFPTIPSQSTMNFKPKNKVRNGDETKERDSKAEKNPCCPPSSVFRKNIVAMQHQNVMSSNMSNVSGGCPVVLNSSCEPCRQSKVKCSGEATCQRCKCKGYSCVYNPRKKRGKARESCGGYMRQDACNCDPADSEEKNEVLEFCMRNEFPMKFIARLGKANVNDFKTAAEITEEELNKRFGELSYEQTLKWRARIKQAVMENYCQNASAGSITNMCPPEMPLPVPMNGMSVKVNPKNGATVGPNITNMDISAAISSAAAAGQFDESQCAKFLSNLNSLRNATFCNGQAAVQGANGQMSKQETKMEDGPIQNNMNMNQNFNALKFMGMGMGFDPCQNVNLMGLSALAANSFGFNPNINPVAQVQAQQQNALTAQMAAANLGNMSNGAAGDSSTGQLSTGFNSYWQNFMNMMCSKGSSPQATNQNQAQQSQHLGPHKVQALNLPDIKVKANGTTDMANTNPCPISSFMNKMSNCKKRKLEKQLSLQNGRALTAAKDSNVKSRMEIVDWLVTLLGKLQVLCNTTEVESIKKLTPTEVDIDSLNNVLTDIVGKIENLEAVEHVKNETCAEDLDLETDNVSGSPTSFTLVEKDKEELEKMQNKTFDLLSEQFEKLKVQLKK